ncbi:MAG: hypothetical protein V1735_07685 [Nanoarchaeota archaeon]
MGVDDDILDFAFDEDPLMARCWFKCFVSAWAESGPVPFFGDPLKSANGKEAGARGL